MSNWYKVAVGAAGVLVFAFVVFCIVFAFKASQQDVERDRVWNHPEVGERARDCEAPIAGGNCKVWQYSEEGWSLCASSAPPRVDIYKVRCDE